MKPKNSLWIAAVAIFVFLAGLPCQAQFTWSTNADNTITITGYTGSGSTVTIPRTIDGLPVTGIASDAFVYPWTQLTIVIPETVTNIDNEAFNDSLIGWIEVDSLNPFYSTADGVLFNKDASVLIRYPNLRPGPYAIPNSVTSIGTEAFLSCVYLLRIAIPNTVGAIGNLAFARCSLQDVTIPDSVVSIGDIAFFESALTNVWIGAGVASIGELTFVNCQELMSITVDPSNAFYSSTDGVLFDLNQTTLVQYPAGKAGAYTIPNTVNTLGSYGLSFSFGLTSVSIPNSVTNIENGAFCSSGNLTNVDLPNTITAIYAVTFQDCTNLCSVRIDDNVTYIGLWAFSDCIRLTNIVIPSSVDALDDGVFNQCTNLAGVYFKGNAPFWVGSSVFAGDSNAICYFLPGTSGWGPTFGGLPTASWSLPNPLILNFEPSFGIQTNQFGFIISWATNVPVVVEATTDLGNPAWSPVATNTLNNGSVYFSDPQWSNYPARFYRIRSP